MTELGNPGFGPPAPPPGSAGVRLARQGDDAGITQVQVVVWRADYGLTLPTGVVDSMLDADPRAQWRTAIESPPTPRHRVLVAHVLGDIVGFAALSPSEDDDADEADGELLLLEVRPDARRQGHASRLLAAAVEHLRADGVRRATCWLFADDVAHANLLVSAGWAPDGSRRALDMGEAVEQVRLHTDLGSP